jgi:hypothetical protein
MLAVLALDPEQSVDARAGDDAVRSLELDGDLELGVTEDAIHGAHVDVGDLSRRTKGADKRIRGRSASKGKRKQGARRVDRFLL